MAPSLCRREITKRRNGTNQPPYKCDIGIEEQDKSSDIEQQLPFGDRKYSNTLPQKRGEGLQRQKGRDLTQSYDKSPYTKKMSRGKVTTQTTPKKFDHTAIADRLRMVSWSNSSYPTGVLKPVYGRQTFPLTATAKFIHKFHLFFIWQRITE